MKHFRARALPSLCLLAATSLACAGAPIPQWPGQPSAESARAVLQRSAAAHGGDLFAEISDLSVSYEGEWGRLVPRMQPEMADKTYRSASEERYLLADRTIAQLHTGPAGSKAVLRTAGEVVVRYDEEPTADPDRRTASALVADAYLMMITGPSWFLRPGVEASLLSPVDEDGRTYERVRTRFQPGFGEAQEDRALLWIDLQTGLLHRVQFSIDGFHRTVGAEVDVTFHDHREIAGRLWPTRFVERVRQPLSAFAHRWRLVGLDVDRGLSRDDLRLAELSPRALAPAGAPLSGPGETAVAQTPTSPSSPSTDSPSPERR